MSRRIMLVLALVALLVVSAMPAIADVIFDDDPTISNEFSERRITSGAASPSFSFTNSGDNVNACPTNQQIVNTGNVANEQGVTQYFTDTDDIDLTGSTITIDGTVSGSCTQTLDQAAAGG